MGPRAQWVGALEDRDGGSVKERISTIVRRIDGGQRTHSWLAFPVAVVKKFGEDRGGTLAAQVAYYGFFSIFPLLLVLVSILGFLLAGDERFQREALDSSLASFPVVGDQIRQNIGSLGGSTSGIVIGLVTATWAGLGIVRTLQTAMNQVWDVPPTRQQSFVPRTLRALAFLLVVGVILVSAAGVGVVASRLDLGSEVLVVFGLLLSLALNAFVFFLVFRYLTSEDLTAGDVIPGALVAAGAWFGLQQLGTAIVNGQIAKADSTYGTFAIVIGLLFWLHLGAQVTLLAAEVNVVRSDRLWPRSLVKDGLTDGDRRAFDRHVRAARLREHPELRGDD